MELKIVKEFTVVRSRWTGRKDNDGPSCMLAAGNRCCLGFMAEEAGIPDSELLNRWFPAAAYEASDITNYRAIKVVIEGCPIFGPFEPARNLIVRMIATVNDDGLMPQDKKESALTKLFAENGITVKFVD